jgi:hypothetical protein
MALASQKCLKPKPKPDWSKHLVMPASYWSRPGGAKGRAMKYPVPTRLRAEHCTCDNHSAYLADFLRAGGGAGGEGSEGRVFALPLLLASMNEKRTEFAYNYSETRLHESKSNRIFFVNREKRIKINYYKFK